MTKKQFSTKDIDPEVDISSILLLTKKNQDKMSVFLKIIRSQAELQEWNRLVGITIDIQKFLVEGINFDEIVHLSTKINFCQNYK